MTRKKEFLREMDQLKGFLSFVEMDLDNVRYKMSEHAGLTHEDEVKLLGLTAILRSFSKESADAIVRIENFIQTHKFKT